MKKLSVALAAFYVFLFTFSAVQNAYAQCKTFKLAANGDTLNCTDVKNRKQGKWIEHTNALRGNPGFEEEGAYTDGRREGLWRKYKLAGDVISMQNYRWGLLNGKSQYFTLAGLEREESWLALNPDKKYDTLDVVDLYKPDVYHKVVIRNEGRSLKNGKWTYYDPQTGFIQKTENFIRDSAYNPLAEFGIKDKPKGGSDTTAVAKKEPKKTAAIEAWEKKNAGKKKITVRDGRTF